MTDSPPPRVTVTLPGGQQVEGGLVARRQTDGAWVYDVVLPIPAAAVSQIDGEDYSAVPTERAPEPEESFVLQALRHDSPEHRAMVLHESGSCWAAEGRRTIATATEARFFLKHGWATRCEACHPDPG